MSDNEEGEVFRDVPDDAKPYTTSADTVANGLEGYIPPSEADEQEWVPEEAIAALAMEKRVQASESNEELAERIFDENLPIAAQAICWLSAHAGNAQIRFAAAKYVTERKLGKVTDPSNLKRGEDDPLMKFVGSVTLTPKEFEEIEAAANKE